MHKSIIMRVITAWKERQNKDFEDSSKKSSRGEGFSIQSVSAILQEALRRK